MCNRCDETRAAVLPDIVGALVTCGIAGGELLGKLMQVSPAVNGQDIPAPERAAAIDSLLLDSYETQRTELLAVVGPLLAVLTGIKNRVLSECLEAQDRGRVAAEWHAEPAGFVLRATDPTGSRIEMFYALQPGETRAQLLHRVVRQYVEDGGEFHQ